MIKPFFKPLRYAACKMSRTSTKPKGAYGTHLTVLREAAGLTQKQLAKKLGVHHSNIAFWERSDKPPRGDVLPDLAAALGVTLDVLLKAKKSSSSKVALKSPLKGRLHRVFESVAKLPRRQQTKIIDVVEALVERSATRR